jgi:glycosyltransferase involved in cell wall biosynthesis
LTVYPWVLAWLLLNRRRVQAVVDSQNGIPFFSPLVVQRRTPVLLLLHHVHQEQFAMHLPRLAAALGRWLEGPATRAVYGDRAVVTVSASTRHDARRRLALRGPITVAPPGSDLAGTWTVPRSREQRSRHERIVCVGRLVPHKRTELIVDAMPALLRRHPKLELHIVGEGPNRAAVSARAKRLGLGQHVVVHGELPAEQRDSLLQTAWLSVAASAWEGWCLTVLESNIFGVPVVGLRRPGLRDSIRDGETGWLVDEESQLATGIGDALEELADPAEADEWSQRAQAWANRFTWAEMGGRISRVLLTEEGRLAHCRDDRRTRTDLASVVYIPPVLVPTSWSGRFRVGDQVIEGEEGLVALLPGADTASVGWALERAGLPADIVYEPTVRVSVARPSDYVLLEVPVEAAAIDLSVPVTNH